MGSSRSLSALLACAGLLLCGVAATLAGQHGLWGVLTGALLTAGWIGAVNAYQRIRLAAPSLPAAGPEESRAVLLKILLDAAPTPLLAFEGAGARALNRAARKLFATDDRILPAPAELLDPEARYWRNQGRNWRVDRVEMPDAGAGAAMAALIDIEREERTAEARATAELVQILGHELLNGLAPIVSLAESGLQAAASPDRDPALLAEILATLSRRAEGLQRFTAAYRGLARLPEPSLRPVPVSELANDLARLFAGRWPDVTLELDAPEALRWPLDRDQLTQAVWALLQNAAESVSACAQASSRVSLRMSRAAAGLVIEVTDSGPGVPPESRQAVFRPFHTSKVDGSGIGLSLARQIANAHGGALTLEAAPQTTFRISLPQR